MNNRERLLELESMLDTAPFDVSLLRRQLGGGARRMPENEAGHVLRWARSHLDRAGFLLASIDTAPLSPIEAAAHRKALDWLATARSVLVDHSIN